MRGVIKDLYPPILSFYPKAHKSLREKGRSILHDVIFHSTVHQTAVSVSASLASNSVKSLIGAEQRVPLHT